MKLILIVEDEERIASFIDKGLRQKGFQTAIASDGEQALSLLEEQAFDLLLLDLGLPFKDGWTVLAELKAQGKEIPVIIVSASDCLQRNQTSYDFLAKPFRFQDLLKRVDRYLD